MMYSQFSFRHREFVNRVASISVFGLAVFLAGCSGQGVSVSDLQAKRYQEHKTASAPIPSEPVYGYNNSETVAAVARYQQPAIERKKLEPVRVASLDNSYVGSSYAMQPVQPVSQSSNAGPGGARFAQAGPGYYPQSGYGNARPESYYDGDYEPERERVPARYDAERYLRDDHRAEGHASGDYDYYTVVSGDTVYSLAKRFGMTTSELAELNGIIGSKIYVGQKLRISGKPVYTASHRYKPVKDERHDYGEASHEDKYDQYEERGGYEYDERKAPPPRPRTYSSYEDYNAQKSRPYGKYDRREDGYEEREEETDRYRKSYKKPSGDYEKYTVRRGDTLSKIARYFRLDARELAYVNDIPVSGTLYPGQVLRIPHERGEVREYERDEPYGEDEYSERRAPPRRHKPAAEEDDSVPYWKRRAASRPESNSGERKVASAENGVSTPEVVMDDGQDRRTGERRPRASAQEEAPAQDKEPVIAAHSDVKAAGSRPKQAQSSVGDCNELLENPLPRSAKTFREPVQGLIISRFGAKMDETINDGVDFSVPKGTPVMAAENGVIAYTGDELPGFGKLVLVRHADGYVTAYAHNDEVLVNRCDVVKRGQVISRAGATGKVTKPQLHFEIRKDAKPVDPEGYFARS